MWKAIGSEALSAPGHRWEGSDLAAYEHPQNWEGGAASVLRGPLSSVT